MKKKLFIALLSLVCAICCLFGLAACNGGNGSNNSNGEDKVRQNAEFVEYRQKVVAVLKDNNIFVNDYDNKTQSVRIAKMKSYVVAASWQENKNSIKDMLVKNDNLQGSEDYKFFQKQVYAMSLRMSLCIGDGISTYFGETDFYGITIRIYGTYMKVTKSDNVTTLQIVETNDAGEDYYTNITLDFKSKNEYTFTSMGWNGINDDIFFAYGNSDHELFTINSSNKEITYSPDSITYYATEDEDVFNECVKQVEYAKPASVAPFIALKNELRYTINDEQSAALFDKYFKDVTVSAVEQQGIGVVMIAGKRVAVDYRAIDGETTVEIPDGTDYISDYFSVSDKLGNVRNLFIPSTVKGVVSTNDPETGGLRTEIQTVDPKTLRVDLTVENQNIRPAFENIIVEKGSAVFQSGKGSLYTKDGSLVYLADSPLENFDVSMLTDNILETLFEGNYTHIFDKIAEFSFDLKNDDTIITKMSGILYMMKALTTLNLTGDFTQGSRIEPLNITVNKPLTVNCDFVCDWKQYGGNPLPALTFTAGSNRTATVNLKGMSRIESINSDGVDVTVNLDVPQALYTAQGVDIPQGSQNVRFVYSEKFISSVQASVFRFEEHNKSGVPEMKVAVGRWHDLEPSGVTEIAVPEFFQYDITAVEMRESDIKTVILTSKIKYLIFEEYEEIADITFKYSGTLEEFENNIKIICYADNYSFTLNYDGGSKLFSGSQSIPSDELCTVTFDIGTKQIVRENVRKGKPFYLDGNGTAEIKTAFEAGISYVWYGSDNTTTKVKYYFNQDSFDWGEMIPGGDTVYTLAKVNANNDWLRENVNLSKNGFTCNGEIYWANMSVGGSFSYNGVNAFATDSVYLNKVNRFYVEGKITDKDGNAIGEKFIDITFKIVLGNDGYLSVDIDTVAEGQDGG